MQVKISDIGTCKLVKKPVLIAWAFFIGLMVGYEVRLILKVNPMSEVDLHSIGYLIIGLIYVSFYLFK